MIDELQKVAQSLNKGKINKVICKVEVESDDKIEYLDLSAPTFEMVEEKYGALERRLNKNNASI